MIKRILEGLRALWRGDNEKYTVACDRSPFWGPHNDREELFHCVGKRVARRIAKRWVRQHTFGQARVLKGHHDWEKR